MADLTASSAAQMGSIQSGTAGFGPLTIRWTIDINIPRITVDASVHGISIGHTIIDTQHPTATLGGNIGIAEAEVVLTANFNIKELDYDVDVKTFGHTIVAKKGKLIGW